MYKRQVYYFSRRNVQPIIELGQELQTAVEVQKNLQEVVDSQRPIICTSYVRQLLSGTATSEDEVAYMENYLGITASSYYNVLYIVYYNNFGDNVENALPGGVESVEELEKIMPDYVPRDITESNTKIKRVVSALIDGTVSDGGSGVFRELYFALMEGASWHVPDNYYLLGDLDSYVKAKLAVNRDYSNELAFAKKCWLNICSAGKFSSDRTIAEYAKDIWHIGKV